jgi:hypothetical protein
MDMIESQENERSEAPTTRQYIDVLLSNGLAVPIVGQIDYGKTQNPVTAQDRLIASLDTSGTKPEDVAGERQDIRVEPVGAVLAKVDGQGHIVLFYPTEDFPPGLIVEIYLPNESHPSYEGYRQLYDGKSGDINHKNVVGLNFTADGYTLSKLVAFLDHQQTRFSIKIGIRSNQISSDQDITRLQEMLMGAFQKAKEKQQVSRTRNSALMRTLPDMFDSTLGKKDN